MRHWLTSLGAQLTGEELGYDLQDGLLLLKVGSDSMRPSPGISPEARPATPEARPATPDAPHSTGRGASRHRAESVFAGGGALAARHRRLGAREQPGSPCAAKSAASMWEPS